MGEGSGDGERGTGAGAEAPATKDRGILRGPVPSPPSPFPSDLAPPSAARGASSAARPFAKAFASRRDRAPVRGLSLRGPLAPRGPAGAARALAAMSAPDAVTAVPTIFAIPPATRNPAHAELDDALTLTPYATEGEKHPFDPQLL